MQIDFHHGATYVLARLAGLSPGEARIVAYSAQYVDDATQAGIIRFKSGALYQRLSSAHKLLDYRNFEELANHQVWIPFHFLPGNGGLEAGQDPPGGFVDKLICLPDSPVARDMVRACIARRECAYALHRLGITMHVYADTWAHQGFAGISHHHNHASHLLGDDGQPDARLMDRLANYFVGEALPLGHGTVLGNPDRPYLQWGYTDGHGRKIARDNPKDYLEAAEHMCRAMQRFVAGNPDLDVPGLPRRDREAIATLIRENRDPEEAARHENWLAAIRSGAFSFGAETVTYVARGEQSWKHLALGTMESEDDEDARYDYTPAFMRSDWKRFHDALQAHRFELLHDILPRYDICAA